MAEGILKKHVANSPGLDTVFVASAGIDALENFLPDQKTSEVCAKRHIYIDTHKARQLTNSMLNDADIVLCMEKKHKQRILGAYPNYAKQVFLLKEYLRKESVDDADIKDPTGKSKEDYGKCYKEIEKEIRRILPTILKNSS